MILTDGDFATVTDNYPVSMAIYTADGAVHSNVPDGSVIMETQQVIGDGRGAWAVFDTVYNGYRFAIDSAAPSGTFNPIHVTIRWDGQNTYPLTTSATEIEFGNGDQWDEDVILHEYGHVVQSQIYGAFPAIPGSDLAIPHYFDTHTTAAMAFSEGWAHFFAVAANHELAAGDSIAPRDTWLRSQRFNVNFDLEAWDITQVCHTAADPAPCYDIEGIVATILWDVYDQVNDDQSPDWPGSDLLSVAGITPIFDVIMNALISGHRPYTINDFWNGWFARGHDQPPIWGIYSDHGIRMDTTAPQNPNAASSSHSPSVWSNDNTIFVSWSGATDDLSGVSGYSVAWTTSATSIPDVIMDTSANSATSTPLSDGSSWWFHVRTVDWAGNWNGGAFHMGPFYIDTTSPSWPAYSSLGYTKGWDGNEGAWKITLRWFPGTADDNIGTMNNMVYSGGTLIATISTTNTYTTYLAAFDGYATYKIESKDAAGNTSANGPSVTFYVGCHGKPCPVRAESSQLKYLGLVENDITTGLFDAPLTNVLEPWVHVAGRAWPWLESSKLAGEEGSIRPPTFGADGQSTTSAVRGF